MARKKIALIEDDEILSKIVCEEFGSTKFDIKCAFDGERGLELVRSEKPDLVLLDLILPQKHGFSVLEELKRDPDTSGIPVIIMTMLGSSDDIRKGFELGADAYIIKTQYAVTEIVEKVVDFLSQKKPVNKGGH